MSSIHKAVRTALTSWLSSVFATINSSVQSPSSSEILTFPDISMSLLNVTRDASGRQDFLFGGKEYTKLGDFSGDLSLELLCNSEDQLELLEDSIRTQWLLATEGSSDCLRLSNDNAGYSEPIQIIWDGNMQWNRATETHNRGVYRLQCDMFLQYECTVLRISSSLLGTLDIIGVDYNGEGEVNIPNASN